MPETLRAALAADDIEVLAEEKNEIEGGEEKGWGSLHAKFGVRLRSWAGAGRRLREAAPSRSFSWARRRTARPIAFKERNSSRVS